jgi:hypothetical protein
VKRTPVLSIDRWSFWARLTRRFRWVSKQLVFNVIFSGVLFVFTSLFMIGESVFNSQRKVAGPVATTAADTVQRAPQVSSQPAAPAEFTPPFTPPMAASVAPQPSSLPPRKKAKSSTPDQSSTGIADDSKWLRPNQFEAK